ncbi:rhodanese-like domain-containing protein [Novosphingobium sp. SG720]|uniref:rhodanese-like domain-containing protein n=1 Tax=Novosphingobium sp. SG720 TaxID=2586998 RepID=UPI0017CFAE6E|nr:rhodanese-like domain-containing protein [Novosphingobium sp. SG720]NKJ42955.1 PQQ-dependent catabolism-associated CXXCW motif protein [Novosphingobium sp. SG720]
MIAAMGRMLPAGVAGAAILALASSPVHAQALSQAPFDAQGYRSAAFRAPVDRDPAPATAISPAQALGLAPGAALFLDVLPAEGARRDGASGAWQLASPHQTIPGALWYPETGRSPPDPVLWQALAARVAAFRQQHRGAPIVVFCRADCWMSWNVARRLALGGVTGVRWLAEGIEGWHDAGGSLVDTAPVPVPNP